MAIIDITDKAGLGEYITGKAQTAAERQLLRDDDYATTAIGKFLAMEDMPAGHKLHIHFDEDNVTHIILPLAKDAKEVVDGVIAGGPAYPDDYVDRPLRYIDAVAEPMKALFFRIGEYTMGRCKT